MDANGVLDRMKVCIVSRLFLCSRYEPASAKNQEARLVHIQDPLSFSFQARLFCATISVQSEHVSNEKKYLVMG